jgi:hypothetical protein
MCSGRAPAPTARAQARSNEAVLRYRLCPPEVMLGQLDRLVVLSTMPTIRFGVIPFEAKLPLAPVHGFWLMDERVVVVENFTASQNLTQASEISAYVRIFDQFAGAARYEPARKAGRTLLMSRSSWSCWRQEARRSAMWVTPSSRTARSC